MKKIKRVGPSTLDGLLGDRAIDGSQEDYKYWAGMAVQSDQSDFKKRASPVNKWQSAYYNGGIF